jgi:hypothetical protein
MGTPETTSIFARSDTKNSDKKNGAWRRLNDFMVLSCKPGHVFKASTSR